MRRLLTLTVLIIIKKALKLLFSHIKFVKRKALKKELNEEKIIIAWHPRRCCNCYMSKDEKKEISNGFNAHQ